MQQKQANRYVVTLDTWLSILAVVTSMCALGATFYQAYLQRKQQYASVWPYLSLYGSNLPADDGTPQLEMIIANKGVGPAIIQGFDLQYMGKSFNSMESFVQAMPKKDTMILLEQSNLWRGRVVSPGEEVHWVKLKGPGAKRMNEGAYLIRVRIRYASVYDEEWELRPETKELVVKTK